MPDFRFSPLKERIYPVLLSYLFLSFSLSRFLSLFLILFLLPLFSAGSLAWGQIAPVILNPQSEDNIQRGAGTELHQPDRETLQNLKTAEVLLSEKRYSEAVRLYWQLLQLPEDAFIDPNWEPQTANRETTSDGTKENPEEPNSDKPKTPLPLNASERRPVCYSSLKTYIQGRLATMGEEGQEVTRIVIEPQAKQALERALTSGQTDQLSAVGKQYFPSDSGVEALFLLGILELNDGNAQAAMAQFDYLQRFPEISARLDPAFSLLWANCIILAGQQDSRQETLIRLRDRLQSVRWNLDSQPVQGLNEQTSIDQLLAAYQPKLEQFQKARFQSPLPLLSVLWRVPNYDTPLLESFLTHIYEQRNNSPRNIYQFFDVQSVFLPVVHGDLVFMRDLFELTAIDRTTGKRLWKATTQAAGAIQRRWQNARNRMGQENSPWLQTLREAIELRVLFDKTYAALSVDESNVYAIEDIWNSQLLQSQVQSIGNIFRAPTPQLGASESANRLAAYDQKTGRLLWTGGRSAAVINGAREEALDDVSFLGAPLPYNQKLYILGESQDLINLYEIEPKTGKLLWTQPLNQAMASSVERFLNLSVKEFNGMLLCPLSPFSLAAVDPGNQRLLWAFDSRIEKEYTQRFFRNANAINILSQQMKNFFQNGYQQRLFSLYRANGRILYSPMDANVVFSLDETTGKPVSQLNTYQPCQILAVKDSTVFLLSANRIEMNTTLLAAEKSISGSSTVPAENGSSPESLAEKPVPVETPQIISGPLITPPTKANLIKGAAELPAGTSFSNQNQTCNLPQGISLSGDGFRYKDFLYLPVSGGELLEFSLTEKKFTTRISRIDEQPLGNLIFDGEQVFSQSFLSLDAFDIRELVEGRIQQQLQEQPDSFRYLTYGAYLAWSTENWDQAAEYLLKLYARQPRFSLKLLQKFFDAAAEKSPEILDKYEKPLEELLVSPEEKTWFLKYQANRLAKDNQVAKCLERLKLLQEIDLSGVRFITIQESGDRSLTQRSDVWFGAFLQNLYQKTDDSGRERIRQRVRDHVKELVETSDVNALIRSITYYAFLPESAPLAQRLFQLYVKRGQLPQAELVLRQIRYAPYANDAQKAQAWFLQAKLLSDLRPEEAAIALRQIKRQYPQEKVFLTEAFTSEEKPTEEKPTEDKPAESQTVDQYVQSLPVDSPIRKAYLQPPYVWQTGDLVGTEEKSETAFDQQNRSLDSNRMVAFSERYPFLCGLTARLNVQPPQRLIFRDSFGRQKMSFPVDSQQQQGRIVIQSQSASARSPWWAAEHLFIFSGKNGELSAVNYLSRRPAIIWEQSFAPESSAEDPWSMVQKTDHVFTNALPQPFGVYANTILFCYGTNQIIGVEPQTGTVKWRRTIPVNCRLSYANERYYLISDTTDMKAFGANDKQYPFSSGVRVRKYSLETGTELDQDKSIYYPSGAEYITEEGCVYYKDFQTVINQNTVSRSIGLYSPDEQKNRWTKTIERKSENSGFRSIEPTVYEKEKLLVLNNPDGEIEIFDLFSGQTLVKTQVEAIPAEERDKLAQQYDQFQLRKQQKRKPENLPALPQQQNLVPQKPNVAPDVPSDKPKDSPIKPGEKSGEKSNEKSDEKPNEKPNEKSELKQPIDGADAEPIPEFMPGIQKRTLLQPYARTHVLRDGDDILLIAFNNTEFFRDKVNTISQFFPSSTLVINRGQLYRFNSEGKMVWSKPVPIERQFYYTIADGLPFLMLGRNFQTRSAKSTTEPMTGQILFIDKKTGVQWKYEAPEALAFVDITGSPESNSIRLISSSSAPVNLTYTTEETKPKREPGDCIPIPIKKADK